MRIEFRDSNREHCVEQPFMRISMISTRVSQIVWRARRQFCGGVLLAATTACSINDLVSVSQEGACNTNSPTCVDPQLADTYSGAIALYYGTIQTVARVV